jgi:hypothetical protein
MEIVRKMFLDLKIIAKRRAVITPLKRDEFSIPDNLMHVNVKDVY